MSELEIYNRFLFDPSLKAIVSQDDKRIYQPVWGDSISLIGFTETDPDLSYFRYISYTFIF